MTVDKAILASDERSTVSALQTTRPRQRLQYILTIQRCNSKDHPIPSLSLLLQLRSIMLHLNAFCAPAAAQRLLSNYRGVAWYSYPYQRLQRRAISVSIVPLCRKILSQGLLQQTPQSALLNFQLLVRARYCSAGQLRHLRWVGQIGYVGQVG